MHQIDSDIEKMEQITSHSLTKRVYNTFTVTLLIIKKKS